MTVADLKSLLNEIPDDYQIKDFIKQNHSHCHSNRIFEMIIYDETKEIYFKIMDPL